MSPETSRILLNIAPLIFILAFFYFFLIRPQKKKETKIKEMRENLKVGDKILTIGGILGKIVQIKSDYLVIETSGDKTKMEIMKWGVNSVVKNNADLKSTDE